MDALTIIRKLLAEQQQGTHYFVVTNPKTNEKEGWRVDWQQTTNRDGSTNHEPSFRRQNQTTHTAKGSINAEQLFGKLRTHIKDYHSKFVKPGDTVSFTAEHGDPHFEQRNDVFNRTLERLGGQEKTTTKQWFKKKTGQTYTRKYQF
jgi:hypothetical protein